MKRKSTVLWVYFFELLVSLGAIGVVKKQNPDYQQSTSIAYDMPTGNSTLDSLVLVDLFHATDGPNWYMTWDLHSPLDTWYGVSVNQDGHVIMLDLSFNNLTGTIPVNIGDLEALQLLNLGLNNLSGTIPASLGDLSNLVELLLLSNDLQGTIPEELGALSNLRLLRMANNQLEGIIPESLGNLTNLDGLYMGGNYLTGTIPDTLRNLQELSHLDLGSNFLSGGLAAWWGELTDLVTLNLNNNALMGNIPPEMSYLTQLQFLSLSGNSLSGFIPAELEQLDQLIRLDLAFNELNGTIPEELGSLQALQFLDLDNNNLEGEVPDSLTSLSMLIGLYLHNNQLTSVPDFSGLTPEEFSLFGNRLTFADILPNIGLASTGYFAYSPQSSLSLDTIFDPNTASTVTFALGVDPGITTNIYAWHQNGVQDSLINGIPERTFPTVSPSDYGSYEVEVTNPNAPELTILIRDIRIGDDFVGLICDQAVVIPGDGTYQASGPSAGGGCYNCARATNSNWYTFTPTTDGLLTIASCNGGADTRVFLYEGTCETLNEIAQNDDACAMGPDKPLYASRIEDAFVEGGKTYFLEWDDRWDHTGFEFTYSLVPLPTTSPCRLSDSLALVAFYQSTNGPVWENPWDLSKPLEAWQGVETNANGCVSGLSVYFERGSGTLPPELGDLSELVTLELTGNRIGSRIGGSIPPELGSLDNLETLILSANQLTGTIPNELGALTNLRELNLRRNELSGSIPPALGELANLSDLSLGFNNLSGAIPPELTKLNELVHFELRANALTGSIPSALGDLPNLVCLDFHANQLTGCIPASLVQLCGNDVDLSDNPGLPNNGDFEAYCTMGAGSCDPFCTDLLTPTPGTVDVDPGTMLVWSEVPNADGYLLDIGVSPGGSEIVSNIDVGQDTFYSPPLLPNSSVIYVKIKPYEGVVINSLCNSTTFTTVVDISCQATWLRVDGDPITVVDHRTTQSISSAGTVAVGTSVTFQAGQSITLEPGFVAEPGSTFRAFIGDCTVLSGTASKGEVPDAGLSEVISVPSSKEDDLDLTVFPNPFQEVFTMGYTLQQATNVHIELFSTEGRLLQTIAAGQEQAAGSYSLQINHGGLKPGLYVLVIRTNEASFSRRLVKTL